MPKVVEWLSALVAFLCVWTFLLDKVNDGYSMSTRTFVTFLPATIILLLGVLSMSAVLWKTYKFHDCPKAAAELKKQIGEARADLKKKGLRF